MSTEGGNVVDLSGARARKQASAERWDAAAMKTLPFTAGARNEYGWPETFWADTPTRDFKSDRERGKTYADLTISAMIADHQRHHADDFTDRVIKVAMRKIFESIVEDAVRRRVKGGKGSRTLPLAAGGFFDGLAEHVVEICLLGRP